LTFGRITPEAIAATLNRLGGDPGLRATMRGRALSIRHRYTWETQAQHLLDVYEQVRPKSG
jgi:glycosyltransferase involved in cell wall biosynthesis